jgi:hypothetical protein
MKKEEININGCVIHKTFSYTPKFNNFFFNNFIAQGDEDIDTQFSFTVLSSFIELMKVCLNQQGINDENIEGEFIRYNTYILVSSKLLKFVEDSLSDGYYLKLFSVVDFDYSIVESDVPENFVYLIENNNCINIQIER